MSKNAQSVTSLDISPEQDRNSRMLRYSIAMGTRFICVILAVAVPYSFFTWIFWAGAIFLPYFAVVLANAKGAGKASGASKAVAPTLSIGSDSFLNTPPPEDTRDKN